MSTIHGTGSHAIATPDTTHDAETNANLDAGPPRPRHAADRLRADVPVGVLRQAARPWVRHRPQRRPTRRETVDRFGDAAWIHGGSPTQGFLTFGADGPFKGFYHSIAGAAWVDWLFMLGLLGIGLALTFGVGMRFAAVAGAVMYVLMWTVVLPPENNPIIDEHILGAITVVALAVCDQRRRHLGTGPPLGGDRAGEAEPVPPLNSPPPSSPTSTSRPRPHRAARPRPLSGRLPGAAHTCARSPDTHPSRTAHLGAAPADPRHTIRRRAQPPTSSPKVPQPVTDGSGERRRAMGL